MFDEFRKYIEDNHLFGSQDYILLAVSGGLDSMVMSHLFLTGGYKFAIAHCNYCLRGAESDKDEDFVRQYAACNGFTFYSRRFDTTAYAKKFGISVQMAARNLRYEWFESIRKEHHLDYIAVGHNMNDNVETLLINLTRGTGLNGLTGMKPVSDKVVRPLLFATREEIISYGKQNNVAYREDQSNLETKYTRNKIRNLILPVLKKINPSVEYAINDTAHRLSETGEIISDYINDLRVHLSVKGEKETIFSIDKLNNYLNNSTIIFELFRPFGITGQRVKDLINILHGSPGGQVLTDTHRFIRDRQDLIITPVTGKNEISVAIRNINDLVNFPGIVSAGIFDIGPDFRFTEDPFVAELDLEMVLFPLLIRTWKKGDYFYPLGMKDKKKLSDYFIDRKYSLDKKESTLLLESGGMIAWIIGERIDDRFRINESTSKVLRIRARRL
jgi:tRNA(Ile)-lysidine synthase